MGGLLEEVSRWKLDARFEDTDRYFYELPSVASLLDGSNCFVIGRKGTGKSAISEKIRKIARYDVFTEKLTFKNFPFNELYSRHDSSYTPPNQYITIWKYIIYSFVCRLMARSAGVDPTIASKLSEIYRPTSEASLRRLISGWTANDFSINVLGTGAKVSRLPRAAEALSWIKRCDILEEVVLNHCDRNRYYVVFDELDEDYKDIVKSFHKSDYLNLLTSLFKAVQDVRQAVMSRGLNIYPVVFLRDDIYDLLQDADKNKWNDFMIQLEWSKPMIQDLLAFRISRALDNADNVMLFNVAWPCLFSEQKVKYGFRQRKRMEAFDFIARSTQMRPRDFIRYIQVCAQADLNQGLAVIAPDTVRNEDKSFSNYLRSELEDEIHGLLPDIKAILDVISHVRKQVFWRDEFEKVYAERLKRGVVETEDVDLVLQILFHFSVIGNVPSQKKITVFRFVNKEARFNFSERIAVHRGLYKALQII